MSYTNTTRLGLQKANPGTNQAFETLVFNSNWDKVDAEAVAADARLDLIEANDWVTSARIASNAVGASEIASGAVSADELATNAVTTVKITDLNVTADKLANSLDLTGKTVSVAAPSSGAHASTKTYVDAGDAATLVSANAYTDTKLGDVVVLASGSWSSSTPTVPAFSSVGYRKLVVSFTVAANGGALSDLGVQFTGLTSYDTVTSTFGSTALSVASAQTALYPGVVSAGTGFVVEVDYPSLTSKKTIVGRSNARTFNARSTNAAGISGVTFVPQGSMTGTSGTYEVVGIK